MNETKQNMAPQNSTLINLINDDDVKSIASERLSPIERVDLEVSSGDEDDDEVDEEIPIYIGHVPRYVSGINRKTTCNDIIKALIDDELANTKASKQLICEPQHYTIYERFQDIEHALGGEELIYDLWQNWGDNRNDVQFRLKISKARDADETDDGKAKAKKIRKTGIKKLLKKVLHQGEIIQKHLQDIAKTSQAGSERFSDNSDFDEMREFSSIPTCSKWSNQVMTDTDDELFLVIENNNDNDSGVFITKEQKFFHEMDVDQPKTLADTPKRKFRYSRDFESLKDHAISNFNPHEKFSRASFKFDMVHKEIRTKMSDMKEIIENEQSFLTKINKYSFDDAPSYLQTDFEYVDNVNVNIEYCDNNETMIV